MPLSVRMNLTAGNVQQILWVAELHKENVEAISVKALTRIANERRPGSMGFAEAMILEYNGKKKNSAYRLNIRQLYDRDVSLWAEPDEDDMYDDSEELEKILNEEDAEITLL